MKTIIIIALSVWIATVGFFLLRESSIRSTAHQQGRAEVIAEIKATPAKVETTYVQIQLPPTSQKKPAQPLPGTNIDSLNASWEAKQANKDSLIAYLVQILRANFEDTLQTHIVTCDPLNRTIELQSTPKLVKTPVIKTSKTYIEPPPAYKRMQWWNPTLHGDFFPFTEKGILAGASFSLCSYGSDASSNGMIFYFPTMGLATDTKKTLVATAGLRWNFAHYLPLISDTHLVIVVTSEKKIIVGIGTSL